MSIDCWFLFVFNLLLVVLLCVDFSLLLLSMFRKVELSIAYVFLVVVNFLGLQFSFQNFL